MRIVQYYNRTPAAFALATRVWLRTVVARLRRQELLTNGAALVAELLKCLLARQIPLWTNAPVDELVVEKGRAVGIRVARAGGSPVMVEARKGVLVAAGGFAHNAEMRRKYSADQPNEAEWSIANPGDTGEVLETAIKLGAKTHLLDEAWWLPSPSIELVRSTLGQARQRPGAIYVDSIGERFCNEANSYVEVGKAMYARKAVPCWLIFDDGYRRRYANGKSLPGRLPREWIEQGVVTRADTIEQLASGIGLDAVGLANTVRRFNANAARGEDPEFGRGESAYNRCLGDPGYKPNSALGPLNRAPFYATKIYPSDVGTCGGLVTNENAQVLNDEDVPIPGLYATGNTTATVMGRTYPGAGASIANSMVFAYVAARHAARNSS
jgi:3-oxosteroid 1-dehydrogenase